MNPFSFQRLNWCAFAVCAVILLSIPVLIICDLSWLAYLLAAAGTILYLLLFLAYQRKVSDFFDAVNDGMEQMLLAKQEVELPEVQDHESVFARFTAKLARLYDALRTAEANAEEEKRIMQGMTADLSHQIKTPVANIKMDLEMLSSRQMPPQKQQEFLERAAHQADKMDFLIQSIIKMSRLEIGAIQIVPSKADLAQTLVNALLSVSAAAEQKAIDISVDCPQPCVIRHDPKWTEEAIFNLLDNAVKYTPAGGNIKVQVEMREAGACLTVSDTGMGIPEELQGAVFSKFFRAPNVHNMPGAGVGLYLTRKIMELQDGYVAVTSAGQGSTFAVWFL